MELIRRVILALALALVAGAPALAAGQLDTIATIAGGANKLNVAVYTEGSTVVGLVGIAPPEGRRISFGFNQDEWRTLIALFKKAASIPAGAWQNAGTMAETGTTEPSFLIFYAGPTITMVIADPTHSLVFTLARSDGDAFAAALDRALTRITP